MSTTRYSQYEYTILSTLEDVPVAATGGDNVAAESGAAAKRARSANNLKWSAIVLNRSDYNENVLETRIGKQALPAGGTLQETSFLRTVLRPKQFALLALLAMLMLYALTSTTTNDVTNVLHEAMHAPAMKVELNRTEIANNNENKRNEYVAYASFSKIPSIRTTTAIALQPTIGAIPTALRNTSNSIGTSSIATNTTTTNHQRHSNNTHTDIISNNTLASQTSSANNSPPTGYLVWSERCKMPNLNPLLPEVMHYYKAQKYKPCSTVTPLTQLRFNETCRQYLLSINPRAISEYKAADGIVSCCYQAVERNFTGSMADYKTSLSECMSFQRATMLAPTIEAIIVRCRAKKEEIYVDAYPLVNERADVMQRLTEHAQPEYVKAPASSHRLPNVLLVGIDSISRSNLIRAMPRTAKYLHDNHWFPLNGFNKIADNTYPNLMAVLTGYDPANAFEKCKPTEVGGLDKCTYLWDLFQEHGYVTAYGEDVAFLHTFNNGKRGFLKPPTDYYMRPFYLSAEKALHLQYKSGLIHCMGHKHAAEYTYDYAIEFARRFRNYKHFGLFWTNSFSHNALSDPSSMDERMVEYLKQFETEGMLDNSIIVFFSDHGIRFGDVRRTLSGHYEERLPFMFLWLPKYFKQAFPEFVHALNLNKHRLTNFYDLHMTLKHVLLLDAQVRAQNLSGEEAYAEEVLTEPAEGCKQCQTLFKPVPESRSCEDAAIADHWCTCIPYETVKSNTKLIKKLAQYVVDYINNFLQHHTNKSIVKLCAKLELDKVEHAYRAILPAYLREANSTGPAFEKYRLVFYTKPSKGIFEATVRYAVAGETDFMELTGDISRLNAYVTDSKCIADAHAKKYCSCAQKKAKIK